MCLDADVGECRVTRASGTHLNISPHVSETVSSICQLSTVTIATGLQPSVVLIELTSKGQLLPPPPRLNRSTAHKLTLKAFSRCRLVHGPK